MATVLHDYALRFLDIDDFHHVLERQRLEIQTVRRVVVRGDGLRIAVDHDRFVAAFPQRHSGMHAAVVKFNALPDTIRAAAQNHDLGTPGGCGFAFFFIR